MTLSITALHYADCRYAKCRILFIVMLMFIMLNVVMLSVIILIVVAPWHLAHFLFLICDLLNGISLNTGKKTFTIR
jgi:hypothetical protein